MFNLNQSPISIDAAILVGLFLVTAGCIFAQRWVNNKYPPGPKGIPFLGIRLSDKDLNDFEEWGKKYGGIMYMEGFGQGMVLLNSHTAAVDLLDRRGGDYRYRPRFIVVNELLTNGLFLTSTNNDDLWRRMRRVGHECMNKTAVSRYYLIQQKEALIFTENLLRDSKEWYQEVHRTTISGLLSALYDIPPTLSRDDSLIRKLNDFDKAIVYAGYPGNYLVESLTWMKYLPAAIAPWKKTAEEVFVEFSALFMKLFRDVERQMDEGDEKPGMVAHSIRQRERLGLSDSEASWIPAGFLNGSLATAETMLWFFLAMVAYPDKQRKCQEELDTVVGRSRMPTFEDRDKLPYMKATVRELLRWRPIAPVGVPHVTKQDDWYQGYLIPKGTSCYAHIWFMNRDRTIYGPDADDFNPDRFINEHGQLSPALADTKDEGHVTYGFGPRLCPGRHFANDTLFVTFATLLWAATISPAVDKQTGNPVIPDLMATVGVTIRPPPFECVVKPRFTDAAEMVGQTKEVLG